MKVRRDFALLLSPVACVCMFHRFSTWWRALSVVLLGLATFAWPSAAQAQSTPIFSVISQDAVANMTSTGNSVFSLRLALASGSLDTVQLSLYPQVVYRSEIAALIDGNAPSSSPISSTFLTSPTCVTASTLELHVSLFSVSGNAPSRRCGAQPLHLRLPCATTACDGVYPLNISVTLNHVRRSEWSLIAVHVANVAHPLLVDYVVQVDASTWTSAALAQANFAVIARHPTLPLTMAVDYIPMSRAVLSSHGQRWRVALSDALSSAQHRAIVAPSPNADLAGLAENGFSTEVSQQLALASQLLRSITGRFSDGPLYITGPTSPSALNAVSHTGASDVVFADLAFSPPPSNTLGWGAPFHVAQVNGITGLATDSGLEALALNSTVEPGRRAAMTMATLAFLHFEAPNAEASRTVVVPLHIGSLTPIFLEDLFGASESNPFIAPSTLSASFNPSLIGTNNGPSIRSLSPTPPSSWSSDNIATLASLISRTNSFLHAVASTTQSVALQFYLANAEQIGDATSRQNALSSAAGYLNHQLSEFRIDDSAITLTGSGNVLPITLFSSAPYPVTVNLHFITDRLKFPHNKKDYLVQLSTSTTQLRIAAADRQGGSLTLQVELTTPDDQIVLAHAAVQVRGVGTSVVGYLLSGASLLVLAWWWLNTYWRKSRGRHAR